MRGFLTIRTVEIVVCLLLLGLAALVVSEGLRLGAGWNERGPQSGFFPFGLALVMGIGLVAVVVEAWREPETRPFFEAPEEWIDLLKVGVPSGLAILLTPSLGLYITSGLYVFAFMAWYGRYAWRWALLGGVLVPAVLYLLLRYGFNIGMPMSPWYRQGILPV
jgi:putative tricarboxylic transport membrane protein